MTTRRAFLKSVVGLGAGLLPWLGWPRVLKNIDSQVVQASIRTDALVPKAGADPLSGAATSARPQAIASYLQRTARDDILRLTQPDFQGRRAGSAGEGKAAAYLADQMLGLGLIPLGDQVANNPRIYEQAFTIYPVVEKFENFYYGRHLTFAAGDPKGLRTPSANILGGLMGTQSRESVILSAHYDHMGIFEGNLYPGANDNASGVGCMLDVMRRLTREGSTPKRNVVLAFWGGEEMGFVGSSAFIQSPTVPLQGIQAVLNADTVGNGPLGEFALWSDGSNRAVEVLQAAAADNKASAPLTPSHGYNSDQFYFNLHYIPAATLMTHNWLEKNHTPQDTPAFINPQKLSQASEIVYQAVRKLAF